MSRAPYDRFREERSDTSKLSCLSGVRRRDLISWLLLTVMGVACMLIAILSPIAGVLVYLYAPELLGLLGIFVTAGTVFVTGVGILRKLFLEIADRTERRR